MKVNTYKQACKKYSRPSRARHGLHINRYAIDGAVKTNNNRVEQVIPPGEPADTEIPEIIESMPDPPECNQGDSEEAKENRKEVKKPRRRQAKVGRLSSVYLQCLMFLQGAGEVLTAFVKGAARTLYHILL